MRKAGRVVADVLALMEEELKPGVTTAQLDGHRRGLQFERLAPGPRSRAIAASPASICVFDRPTKSFTVFRANV